MQLSWRALLIGALASACASSEPPAPGAGPAGSDQPAVSAVVAAQACEAVSSLEIVHRVSGAPVTTKVVLEPATAADPVEALRAFQRATDFYGQANIISTRQLAEVFCFPATTQPPDPDEALAARGAPRKRTAPVANADGVDTCIGSADPFQCVVATPTNQYAFSDGTGSCTVTNLGEAVTFGCDDSGLIMSSKGEAVITINSTNVRAEVLARTQALRRLVGDANVLTNFHFNVVISPDQQAALVDNAAYNAIAQQLTTASQLGQPLPDITALLASLPTQPTNVAFKEQLEKAYKTRQDRLDLLAAITNGSHLSNAQVNAFYQQFVGKSQLIDKLIIEDSLPGLKQAATAVNDTITQLVGTSPASTIYEQVKSGARALLESETTNGVLDPAHIVPFTVPELYRSLTDADLEKQQIAALRLIDLNETLRKSDALPLIQATSGLLGLLSATLADDDVDASWRVSDQVEAAEFFVENTDVRGTRFDVHLTPAAKTMFSIDVSPTSAAAYDVIVVLNETADYNKLTGKVTVDYQAIISLNARQALATSDALRALYHTEEATSWLNVAKGFTYGLAKEYGSMAAGVLHMVGHPIETYEGLKAAIVNWDQTLAIVWAQGAEMIHRWPNMTAAEKAEFLGHVAAQIEPGLLLEAMKAGRLEEAITDAAKLQLDKASTGLSIIEHGGAALAPEAASELARRMEQLGVTSVDDMVALADKLDDYLPCALVGGAGFQRVGILTVKPPCNAGQIAGVVNVLEGLTRELTLTDAAAINETMIGAAKVRLTEIGDRLWESDAGLRYGPDPDAVIGHRINHVMEHLEEAADKLEHGVFDVARKDVLALIDEGWKTVTRGPSPDWTKVVQADTGNTLYKVNMHRAIGHLGGSLGNGAETDFLAIIVKTGTSDVITSFPCPALP